MAYTTVVTGTAITAAWGNGDVRDQVIVPFASTAARDSAITSPVVGMVEYIKSNDSAEGLTTRNSASQWRLPWNMPWGIQGVATVTASQTGITTEVDVTSLTVTWTAVANRRICCRVHLQQLVQNTSNGEVQIKVTDASNVVINQARINLIAATNLPGSVLTYESGITAGSTTRKVRALTSAGTLNIGAAATAPMILTVEDLGPSGAPA